MATQPDQTVAYAAAVAAYQAQTLALRLRLTAVLERVWRSLGTYRAPQMAAFARTVVPVVAGAQQQMIALTAANLAQQKQVALGGRFTPVAVDARQVTGSSARNGTDPADVYARPFHLVWRQLHELPHEAGAVDRAVQAGLDRATQSALTDLQLTKQQTARQVLAGDDQVTGYRRVLEGAQSCGLCIVASTQRYHKAALMPIHPACDCGVSAIYGDADPGRTLQATVRAADGTLMPVADLPDVHDRVAERFGTSSSAAGAIAGTTDGHGRLLAYRDVLISHEHGELGPVLAVKGRPFLGPDDLAA